MLISLPASDLLWYLARIRLIHPFYICGNYSVMKWQSLETSYLLCCAGPICVPCTQILIFTEDITEVETEKQAPNLICEKEFLMLDMSITSLSTKYI